MTALFNNRDAASAAAEKLKVYAQPLRLMILSCLLRGERNVAEIGEMTGIGQPALSQQLAELRRSELVRTRRQAKQVWYSLADDGVGLCVRNLEAIFGGLGTLYDLSASERQKIGAPLPDGVAGFARIIG